MWLVQVRQHHLPDHSGIQVPLEMMDARFRDHRQSTASVQLLQSDVVVQINRSFVHRNDVQTTVVVAEMAGLPGRDDAVVGSANQYHLVELQEAFAEARGIVGFDFVVDVRKEWGEIEVELLLAGIVPVVADGCVLADVAVEQLVGGLGHQIGKDEV